MRIKLLKKIKRIAVILLITVFVVVQTPLAIAQEAPTTPDAPTAPDAPENTYVAPTPPTAPTAPDAPENTYVAPTPPTAPTESDSLGDTSGASGNTQTPGGDATLSDGAGTDVIGGSGDNTVVTGDANNSSYLTTNANSNLSATPEGGSGSVTVANDGNGALSNNSGSASVTNTDNTDQINGAQVANDLNQNTISGHNSVSFNTGGDSSIVSGDSNTSGTVITSVNTNVDGVAVAEFNIADDHVGDIVLDFGNACISGCGTGSTDVSNTGNGVLSDNSAQANTSDTTNTDQVNTAVVGSNLNLVSDSGNNDTSFNTNGDSNIVTGDANVSANVLTFANNNLAGNVIYGVVNIYGNLVGDIILTEAALNAFCGNCLGSTSVSNTGNAAGSSNDATANQTNLSDVNQFNNADIQNNLVLSADTGDNTTSANTGGDSAVVTGDANILASVVNIANMNIVGGNYWLVIVNEAGNWIGKLIGFGDSNVAGSEGIEFTVDGSGQVNVSNSGNGNGSDNDAQANTLNSTNINQENNAQIVNNVNLSANTGGNTSSFNTGGDSNIVTGDAQIIASIVNFVNNNIVGAGNLFVTVINVFGSWVGDFIGPGQVKEAAVAESGRGGTSENHINSSDSASAENQITENNSPSVLADNTKAGILKINTNKVTGLFAGTKVENNEKSEGTSLIAGNAETAADKVLNINLAFLLLLIPVLVFYVAVKKYSYLLLPKRVRNG